MEEGKVDCSICRNELKYETNVTGVSHICSIAAAAITVDIWRLVFQISPRR